MHIFFEYIGKQKIIKNNLKTDRKLAFPVIKILLLFILFYFWIER